MRLHTLELTGIGPYARPLAVDFDRLASGGLFLLEGPTGGGKTTILDAITFALYGGLSGDGSGRDRLRSDFAGPADESSVTLEFSVAGTRYRIRRSPEYQRPKLRGDGFTTQASQVHLQRREGDRWVSQSANKAEAGELVTAAIGLSRDQFTQVMLLPQGEFAKFLRSDDDDRRALLTRLFGTGLYDRITAELDQRRRAAQARQRDADEVITAAVAAAAEAAGLDAGGRDELRGLGRAERGTRLKELGADLALTIEVSRDALAVAADELTRAGGNAQREAQRAGLLTQLADAVGALAEHEATRPEHAGRKARLDQARLAEPVRPLLDELTEARRAVATALAATAELLPEVGTLEGPEQARDRAAVAAEQAAAAERTAAGLEHLVGREASLPAAQAELDRLTAAVIAAELLLTRLTAAGTELPGRIDTLTERLAAARQAAAALPDAQAGQAAVAGLAAAVRAADLAERLDELDDELRAAVDEHQRLTGACQQAMAARLENMAAELASQLTDGAPCPVCGSGAHPAPAAPSAGAVSAADVDRARQLQDEAGQARDRARAARDELATELSGIAAEAGPGSVASLATELAVLDERVRQAQSAAAEAGPLAAELAGLHAERDKLDEDLSAATSVRATASAQSAAARSGLAGLRDELAAAATPYPSVADRQAALLADAAAGRELAAALGRLATALDSAERITGRAGLEVRAGGFADLAAARAAVLAPAEQAVLDEQVMAWTATLASLTSATLAPELAGLDPADCAAARARAQAAIESLDYAQAAEREVRQQCQALTAQDGRLRDRLTELTVAEQAADRLAEQTEPVVRLASLAKGMDGHRRIALTTYVLRHWFEQVVAAANVRLAAMSAGRYELTRTDTADRKDRRAGLTLAVIDRHTGEERGPRSLSGGETFYTSLALALGLADVVRAQAGGVELDTLFIDEGFGSLDSDTLDQVMAVIDELRDRGRAVGIVSHVADLKDRVCERLEVRRLPDGSSTATVIA